MLLRYHDTAEAEMPFGYSAQYSKRGKLRYNLLIAWIVYTLKEKTFGENLVQCGGRTWQTGFLYLQYISLFVFLNFCQKGTFSIFLFDTEVLCGEI